MFSQKDFLNKSREIVVRMNGCRISIFQNMFTQRRGNWAFMFIVTASFRGILERSVAIAMILPIFEFDFVRKEIDVPTWTDSIIEGIVTETGFTSGKTEAYCLMKELQSWTFCSCVVMGSVNYLKLRLSSLRWWGMRLQLFLQQMKDKILSEFKNITIHNN